MFQAIFPTDTIGSEQEFMRLMVLSGKGTKGAEKEFTRGELDEDSVRIKASAIRSNLSEEEAIELVDKIRDELQVNK